MSDDRFKHESLQDSESIVRYLTALADGFRQGALSFTSEDQRLELKPGGLVNLEVEAKKKAGNIKMAIKLRWTEDEEGRDTPAANLVIGSGDAEPQDGDS